MFLRMAALGEGVLGIMLKEELNCGYEIVLGPGTTEYISVSKDVKETGIWEPM